MVVHPNRSKDGNSTPLSPDVEDDKSWETESAIEPNAENEYYDFSLQFSCYILADKLQAPGFKRFIIDEIRAHAEFCDPADMTAEDIRYIYANTSSDDDPLRRFCVMLKCTRTPMADTFADHDFMALMEDGGSLVKDVMQACRSQVARQNRMLGGPCRRA